MFSVEKSSSKLPMESDSRIRMSSQILLSEISGHTWVLQSRKVMKNLHDESWLNTLQRLGFYLATQQVPSELAPYCDPGCHLFGKAHWEKSTSCTMEMLLDRSDKAYHTLPLLPLTGTSGLDRGNQERNCIASFAWPAEVPQRTAVIPLSNVHHQGGLRQVRYSRPPY